MTVLITSDQGDDVVAYEMPAERSLDIDTPWDLLEGRGVSNRPGLTSELGRNRSGEDRVVSAGFVKLVRS